MKRDFIAEPTNKAHNVVKKLKDFLTLNAYADGEGDGDGEVGGNGEPHVSSPTINYEDLIAKARKDEKDKQYKTIEKLKTDLKTMTASNNSNLIRIGELETEVDTLNKKLLSSNTGDSEAVKTLKADLAKAQSDLATAQSDLAKARESVVDESALRTQIEGEIRAEYEVKNYRLELLAKKENQDILVPELVMGTTKEELDASLASARTRSEEIRKQFGAPQTQQSNASAFANRMPAVSSPSASSATASVSLEDLAKLNPASPEYAEMRKKLGLR